MHTHTLYFIIPVTNYECSKDLLQAGHDSTHQAATSTAMYADKL